MTTLKCINKSKNTKTRDDFAFWFSQSKAAIHAPLHTPYHCLIHYCYLWKHREGESVPPARRRKRRKGHGAKFYKHFKNLNESLRKI